MTGRPEAAVAALRWARARGIGRIVALVHHENAASAAVLGRAGFRYTHTEELSGAPHRFFENRG